MAADTPPQNGLNQSSGIIAELIRALVRPIISLYLVGTCGWLWLHGQPVPPDLMTLTTGLVSYWFGERMIAKRGG